MTPFDTQILRLLAGECSVRELEQYIYGHSELEHELGQKLYLELITADFTVETQVLELSRPITEKLLRCSDGKSKRIALELKHLIAQRSSKNEITYWAYHQRLNLRQPISQKLHDSIYEIMMLEEDDDDEVPTERLLEIADQLFQTVNSNQEDTPDLKAVR